MPIGRNQAAAVAIASGGMAPSGSPVVGSPGGGGRRECPLVDCLPTAAQGTGLHTCALGKAAVRTVRGGREATLIRYRTLILLVGILASAPLGPPSTVPTAQAAPLDQRRGDDGSRWDRGGD